MAVMLTLRCGDSYFTDLSMDEVLTAVRDGQQFAIWWYAPWGQRYRETTWIDAAELAYLRTESDD